MKITGYQILDRIEQLKEQVQTLEAQFKSGLFVFEAERGTKSDPRDLMRDFEDCERKVAALQEAQAAYNLQVQLNVGGETVSLHRAVKLLGSLNRVKSQWKIATQDEHNPYAYIGQKARDKENEYAERIVPLAEALQLSETAGKQATALKQAIRAGNATEIDLDIDEALFA